MKKNALNNTLKYVIVDDNDNIKCQSNEVNLGYNKEQLNQIKAAKYHMLINKNIGEVTIYEHYLESNS